MAKSTKTLAPCYVSGLRFENLKCFSDIQTLSFLDRDGRPSMWNLLLGENGVGKTTALQCLAWMRPFDPAAPFNFYQPALIDEEENSVFEKLVRFGSKKLLIEAEFVEGRSDEHSNSVLKTGISVTTDGKGKLLKLVPIDFKKKGKVAPNIQMIAYSANRLVGSRNLSEDKMSDPISTIFETGTTLYDPEAILKDLDYAALKTKTRPTRDLFARVKDLIATILPDVASPDDVLISGPEITGGSIELSGLQLKTPDGTVPFSELSLGYQTTLAWTLDLAWRMIRENPKSKNPFGEPAIVLIDEIDLHLHPKWQLSIRQHLAEHFPATQFIVTAHSPIMALASLDSNLMVFERQDDHVVINDYAERVIDWRIDQVVMELFSLRSPRPPWIEKLFDERSLLLRDSKRTKRKQARLEEIEARIQKLPVWDTPEDLEAMDIIHRAADQLKGMLQSEK